MASSPGQPVRCVPGRGGPDELGREQAADLGDGQRDHPGAGWWQLAGPDRWRGLGVSAFPQLRGGGGADSQGRHDQHGVPGDGGVEADLGLIQPEAVLAGLETLLNQPLLMPLNP